MSRLQALFTLADKNHCKIQMDRRPYATEKWRIKYYPHAGEDAHFYAYHDDVEECARLILDEMDE